MCFKLFHKVLRRNVAQIRAYRGNGIAGVEQPFRGKIELVIGNEFMRRNVKIFSE